ncbi:fluoride efflux transporter CrcB [Jeotgalibacillus salarius]|uniref:Fluoride-specific ion channel FluC n=1 Tax=Jeotgalibacillus salarius TaxID=546023 RepID=A0A4Y8LKA6_9BACL|nr:fluoride efflux transporter CrcB [Jeotgalibacillus salarius]TFE01629.1 fluoride efflux transporter CrcB [Jeotgalibacillus salarius]
MNLLLLGLGGFFGAAVRYLLSSYGNQKHSYIPAGTLFVNLTGSFFLGITIAMEVSSSVNVLLAIGFLGAFTTFSTMQTEAVRLFDDQKRIMAAFYLLITLIGGTLFAALGFYLVITL